MADLDSIEKFLEQRCKDIRANAAHEIWSHWMKYFLENCCNPTGPNGMLTISNADVNRWKRLMETKFDDLTDKEKESDYEIGEMYLKNIIR